MQAPWSRAAARLSNQAAAMEAKKKPLSGATLLALLGVHVLA